MDEQQVLLRCPNRSLYLNIAARELRKLRGLPTSEATPDGDSDTDADAQPLLRVDMSSGHQKLSDSTFSPTLSIPLSSSFTSTLAPTSSSFISSKFYSSSSTAWTVPSASISLPSSPSSFSSIQTTSAPVIDLCADDGDNGDSDDIIEIDKETKLGDPVKKKKKTKRHRSSDISFESALNAIDTKHHQKKKKRLRLLDDCGKQDQLKSTNPPISSSLSCFSSNFTSLTSSAFLLSSCSTYTTTTCTTSIPSSSSSQHSLDTPSTSSEPAQIPTCEQDKETVDVVSSIGADLSVQPFAPPMFSSLINLTKLAGSRNEAAIAERERVREKVRQKEKLGIKEKMRKKVVGQTLPKPSQTPSYSVLKKKAPEFNGKLLFEHPFFTFVHRSLLPFSQPSLLFC